MSERIALFINSLNLNSEIVTILLASLPVLELRGSIPFATFVLNMDWQSALLWSLIGNLLPVPFILLLLKPAEDFLSQWSIFSVLFEWLFTRTRKRGKVIARYKAIGLTLFVAIPLPITGAWTGAVAAHLFGIKFIPAMIFIFLGICISGTVITLACQGVIGFLDFSHRF